MSATLEAERFAEYFDHAPVLYVSGRQFPVEVGSIGSIDRGLHITAAIHVIWRPPLSTIGRSNTDELRR